MNKISENGDNAVILGAHGTLGQQLAHVFPKAHTFDRAQLDVTDFSAVREKLSSIEGLAVVFNCVAWNDVDGAEANRDGAFLLNETVPQNLAEICEDLGAVLVHYSTGFVFDGTQENYDEDAEPKPLSVYAESKYKGEQAVINSGASYYLIRTNVLFGPKGQSEASKPAFVDIMIALSKKTNLVKVVNDEIYSITYAPDLARATKILLAEKKPEGIYHIVNSGFASWYELATETFKGLGFNIITEVPADGSDTSPDGKNITVLPVLGTEFPRPAKRPSKVVLENTKLPALRSWQEALTEYLSTNTDNF